MPEIGGGLARLFAWTGSAWQRVRAGQATSANSLSTVPASDIADATYIGDIKFGEALPAGSASLGSVTVSDIEAISGALATGANVIGKLAANRSAAVTTLIDAEVFDDVQTAYNSAAVATDDFKHFLLFLDVDSTATPTDIQFLVQFSDDGGTTFYTYKQGLFASLFYEDQDTASGITECFSGECAGRDFRLRAVATGTDGTNKFTVTAKVEFWA